MSQRILIIGLDGAVWRVLDPLLAEGRMPTLARLVAEGVSGPLRSTVPPITVPAWSSFMTGKNPAKHGIYEFLRKEPGSYDEHPISARSRRARTIWRILSDAGRTVASLNVPTTYPPEEVRGAMVSDFLTPSGARDFITPRELLPEIEERFGPYYLYMKTRITGASMSDRAVRAMLDDCRAMSDYKTQVAVYLAQKLRPDVLMTHEWGTDRLQHELWDILDPTHPASRPERVARHLPAVKEYFTHLDGKIAELRAAMGDDVTTIVMSDHGFGPIRRIIDLNWWLYEQGYLAFKRDAGTRLRLALWRAGFTWGNLLEMGLRILAHFKPRPSKSTPAQELTMFRIGKKQPLLSMADVDWSRTRAYAKTGMGQIVINVRGREPQGAVEPGAEYERVRREIAEKLLALADPETGQPVGGEVYFRESIYSGPLFEECPDLTFVAQDRGYMATNLTGIMGNRVFTRISGFYGNHTMDGIVVLHGAPFRRGERIAGATIFDLAPTILHLAGLPVPDGMDGKVLERALAPEFAAAHPVATVPDQDDTQAAGRLSEEEEAEVMEKLRGLGYIG